MLTVQYKPATRSGRHESNEIRKSVAFVPVRETLLMWRVVAPRFVRVTDCGELVVPTVCPAKVRLGGDTVTIVPVPFMFTSCWLAPPSSENVSVAVSGPISEG